MNLTRIFIVGIGAALALLGFYVIWLAPTAWMNLVAGLLLVVVGIAILVKKDITIE